MSASDDAVLHVALQWAQKAENDLRTAAHTLKLGKACPTDTVCFHAQQCVEKYLKAALVFHRVDFPRSHHISTLIQLLPATFNLDLTVEEQERLTDYAVSTRYPGEYEPIPLGEARQAVKIARRARNQVRRWLLKRRRRPV